MESRSAVEQYWMVLDDLLEDIPDLWSNAFHDPLCALDVVSKAALDKLSHDEGLKELESHLFRQTALVQLQVRADHDD